MTTKSIDYFIDKIGAGKYQYLIYAILGIYFICDGAEVMALSFLSLVLENSSWKLSSFQVGLVTFVIFAGFFFGSMISGAVADKYGRRKFYIISVFACFFIATISALSPEYYSFLISRAIFGFTIGILQPLTASMLIEITPINSRGRWIIWETALFTVGEMTAVLVAYLTLTTPSSGNWRLLVIWVTVPLIFSAILSFRNLKESPRFALFNNFDEGCEILNYMYKVNKNEPIAIDSEERVELNNWIQLQNETVDSNKSSIAALLSPQVRYVTILIWIMWFTLSFVYYGIIYVIPKTLNDTGSGEDSFVQVFITVLGEIPSYFIAALLVETKTFGRKLSLIVGFFLAGTFCVLPYFFETNYFTEFMFMSKLWINFSFSVIYPFTSEVYHTKIRTTGMGVASATSRIGGMAMPIIATYTLNISPFAPYLIFGLCAFLAGFAAVLLPYDTRGKELDNNIGTKELLTDKSSVKMNSM